MEMDQKSKKNTHANKMKSKSSPAPGEQQSDNTQMHLDYLMPIVDLEIRAMSEAAANGDAKATAALHRIAFRATSALNGQPFRQLQVLAKNTEWWPVNLSWVPSFNRMSLSDLPRALGLGKDVHSLVDMEAVLKRGAPTNWMGCYFVQFVEECRRFGALLRSMRKKWKEIGATTIAPDEQKILVGASNKVLLNKGAIASLMNLELVKPTPEDIQSEMVWAALKGETALLLRPLLESKQSRDEWFEFGMDLVKELSSGEFEKPVFGLGRMNRKAGMESAGRLRAGIRQGIKEGFEAVIANVRPDGFVAVE